MRAFSGTSICSASSTARTLARAWTMVHTPQMRWAQIQASRGSRPCEDQLDAAEHGSGAPGVGNFSAIQLSFNAKVAFNAGDRIDYQARHVMPPFWFRWRLSRRLWRGLDHLDQAVRGDAGHHCAGQSQPDLARGDFDAEAGNVWAGGRRTATCDPRTAARRRRCSRVRRGSANWCDRSTAPPDS